MKTRFPIIMIFALYFSFILKAEDKDSGYNIITNINYKQVDDYIEISYEISSQMTKPLKNITVYFSKDGGDSFQKLTQVAGDVGTVSSGGTKIIKWYIFKELGNETISGNICFKITADYKYNLQLKRYTFMEYSGSITAPLGIAMGTVKKYGFYGRIRFSKLRTEMRPNDSPPNENYGNFEPNPKYSRISVMGGALFRMTNWCFLYVGGGYGEYGRMYYSESSRDISISYKGTEFELGGMIKVKWLLLSVGYTTLISRKMPGFFGDITFGAGFML